MRRKSMRIETQRPSEQKDSPNTAPDTFSRRDFVLVACRRTQQHRGTP
jgi:hypothetical protein